MNEKTEELRDIFVDVAGGETVTESQQEGPGSLIGTEEGTVEERLATAIERLAERCEFGTTLSTDAYVAVVRGFYAGESDETIAANCDLDADTVFAARMDLRLVSEADADQPLDMGVLRTAIADDDVDVDTLATEADVEGEVLDRARRVAAAQNAARRASHRFQSAFEDVLTEAGMADRMTASIEDDGLEEAAEDIETTLSL